MLVWLMETCLPGPACPEERNAEQSHRGARAVCNIYVQVDLICAGNVVTLCAIQSYFSGTLAPFEQHGCKANVAECFVVTTSALELGNDIKYLFDQWKCVTFSYLLLTGGTRIFTPNRIRDCFFAKLSSSSFLIELRFNSIRSSSHCICRLAQQGDLTEDGLHPSSI